MLHGARKPVETIDDRYFFDCEGAAVIYTCALCGRKTQPYAFIGNEAIGPKCAKRAGFTTSRAKVAIVKQKRAKPGDSQIDLFEEENE